MTDIRLLDVRALASDLHQRGGYQNVIRLLDQTVAAQSCHADLNLAKDQLSALQHLTQFGGPSDHLFRRTIESALMSQAVLLYVRAVYDSGHVSERKSLNVRTKISNDARLAHDRLIIARKRVIAHIDGLGTSTDYDLRETVMFGCEVANGWRIGATTRQSTSSTKVMADLDLCINETLPIAKQEFQKRLAHFQETISDIDASIFHSHIVDGALLIQDKEALKKLVLQAIDRSDTPIMN